MKLRLARSGQSLSAFVRAAIVEQLAAGPTSETPYDAWAQLIEGSAGSGVTDRSVAYKERIGEKLRAKHRR